MSQEEVLKKFGFDEETYEEYRDQHIKTGFPESIKRYRIIHETFNMSMEEAYFWVLNYVRQDLGFTDITKTDLQVKKILNVIFRKIFEPTGT